MNETVQLRDQVQTRTEAFLADRRTILSRISPDLAPFSDFSQTFLSGGKRFRATFALWGWRAVTEHSAPSRLHEERARAEIIGIGSAVEMFHAAALVHDDIIDNSDTRRGAPAIHRRFEALAAAGGWTGIHAEFGVGSAVLYGDMLLSWSDELMNDTIDSLDRRDWAAAVRAEYSMMRTEVTAGQYLDILEENAWQGYSDAELVERAHRILTYKSAKYSVEAPLALGSLGAGGTEEQVRALREYGLPVGVAFQLRDDVLGVFGDAQITGKPSGDDLREGKRTVLVALARAELAGRERAEFDRLVGDPTLSVTQVSHLQEVMRRTGALDAVEALIADSVAAGKAALVGAPLGETSVRELLLLADKVSARDA